MGIFNKMKEPVFLKESNNAESQLEKLKALEPLLNPKGQAIIRQDIKYLEYGIAGEKKIAFELKNCHIPMYVLHDVYLEDGDLGAQIDYLLFTKKICFVIECKNLYGNIEINNAGDFIRTTEFGRKKTKVGIYSPITQNQRHIELMKKMRVDSRGNALTRYMVDRGFDDFNKSVVVLANPKTVLNAKFAKKETKEKVIRADQLVKYIKDTYEKSKEGVSSDERMLLQAQFYLDLHKDIEKNYCEKYDQYKINAKEPDNSPEIVSNKKVKKRPIIDTAVPTEENEIFKELKLYRLNKSRELKIKAYVIYSNNQLNDLISVQPKNKKELQAVAGFGESKINKYGDDILEIMKKY